jgi:hypothetical protein
MENRRCVETIHASLMKNAISKIFVKYPSAFLMPSWKRIVHHFE